ncbi:MAG: hypothetical protein M1569_03765 [Candidatus Marsarchaeota archaeon]|nr:hypothetical protein [Candidatus Marsarchaeota archaeon]MCL5413490.1 hypothetical protein [Candidatus Marsarchaeota archaeon]
MPDDVTFIDLACLLRISQDATLEKLGSIINASYFDAANLAGTLKQKGLIDFTAYYAGQNTITVTDVGKALIAEADAKATEPYDNLDSEILVQLSGGKRIPIELQNTLSLRPKDLALRLYKLSKQGFITYELKSGGVDLLLTESGFLKSKQPSIVAAPLQSASQQAPQVQQSKEVPQDIAQQDLQRPAQPKAQDTEMPHAPSPSKVPLAIGVLILIIIAIAALYYFNVV